MLPPLPTRPYGSQVRRPTNVCARGSMSVIKNSDFAGNTGWSSFWGAGYDWTYQQTGIDKLAALGGTSIKTSPPKPALIAGGATTRTAVDRLHKWCDYATSKGLSLYWSLGWDNSDETGLTTNQRVAASVLLAQITNDYPTIGIDISNEVNLIGLVDPAVIAAYCATAMPAIRAVTKLPLTVSLGDLPTAWATNAWVPSLAPFVDFWDWHIYCTPTVPSIPGDLSTWRASQYYKPWVIGESGVPTGNAANSGWPGGVAAGQAVFSMLAQLSQQPDCRGIYQFSLVDYDAGLFGMYDSAFSERTWLTDLFKTWRAVR